MLHAHEILSTGTWDRARRRAGVSLDFNLRNRRRIVLTASDGVDVLLDLARAARLRNGDGLLLESGEVIEVIAAPEPLLELRCTDREQLVRLAWHLGNRHVPTELRTGSLRIRADHVLAEMARGLGAEVVELAAPFDPEGGAYEGAGQVGHHHHDDDHHHPQDHDIRHHRHDAVARASWR